MIQTLIPIIFVLILPTLISSILALHFDQKTSDFLPVLFSFFVILVFVFSIFDNYYVGLICVVLLEFTTIFIGLGWLKNSKKIKALVLLLINPSIVLFILISILSLTFLSRMKFYEWDEFSFWGFEAKSIYLFNQLAPYAPKLSVFPEYVPGLPLMGSMVAETNSIEWQENLVYFAYAVYLISLIIAILGQISWKKPWLYMLSAIAIFASINILFNPIATLYADPVLAILAGYIFILSTSDVILKNTSYLINLSILSAFLCIVKDVGIFFVFIGYGLLFLNLFLRKLLTGDNFLTSLKSSLFRISFTILPSLIIITLWNILVRSKNINLNRNNINAIKQFFTINDNNFDKSYLEKISVNFKIKASSESIASDGLYQLTTMQWFIMLSLCLIAFSFLSYVKNSSIMELIFSLILIAATQIFFEVLIFLYATSFNSAEGYGLASFDRYVGTILTALAVFVTGLAIKLLNENYLNLPQSIFISICFLLLISHAFPSSYQSNFQIPREQSKFVRDNLEIQDWLIEKIDLPAGTKVWVISQHSQGFEFYYIQYKLLPASVGKIPFSIGTPAAADDVWTDQNLTVDLWKEKLTNYDYVFINNIDPLFISEYGSLFTEESSLALLPAMFKVEKLDGAINLVRVL